MNLTRREMLKKAATGVVAGAAVVGFGQVAEASPPDGWGPRKRQPDLENWLLSTVPTS